MCCIGVRDSTSSAPSLLHSLHISLPFVTPLSVAAFLLLSPSLAAAETQVYFGNLHAHSNLSDGNTSITPDDAYRMARDEGGMDFLSLSEHNHMVTQEEMDSLIASANRATHDGFVALFGQEFSTINSGFNHANIQNYPLAIPAARNGHYALVFGTDLPGFLTTNPGVHLIGEFNHPDDRTRDYGMSADFAGNWGDFIRTLDPFVELIALGNGPADANNKTFVPSPSSRFMHRDITTGPWFDYLAQGFRLGPKVDHDTHSPTFGIRVDGRTAVWAEAPLTRDKLLDALVHRHCYATEDRNLKILASLNGQFLPGDELQATGANVRLTLTVSDPDEPGAEYKFRVHEGIPGSGPHPDRVGSLDQSLHGDGTVTWDLTEPNAGQKYYVIKVEQESSTPPCGTNQDDAWLAPIWMGGVVSDDLVVTSSAFVGSKHSQVYHYPECGNVQYISEGNLVHYAQAPAGKRLHQGCPR